MGIKERTDLKSRSFDRPTAQQKSPPSLSAPFPHNLIVRSHAIPHVIACSRFTGSRALVVNCLLRRRGNHQGQDIYKRKDIFISDFLSGTAGFFKILITDRVALFEINTVMDYEHVMTEQMPSLDKIINIWKTADAVTFDVDSTVTTEEGIDELAKFCGKGEKIAELTKQAMQGDMTFQQSLSIRLEIINPSLSQVKEFLDTHQPKLTNGIKELVSALQARGKQVFLVSGGFRCLISPIAAQLNIPPENIYANKLKFYFTGEYAGFDENQQTSKSGGKAEVIRCLKEQKGFNTVVHIGDGATDLEASPPADAFIGFGGNVIRESVRSRAQWFVTNFDELAKSLRV